MNKRDKIRNERLHQIISAPPKPDTLGTKTATFEGFYGYSQDMAIIQNTLRQYYYHLLIEANWAGTDEWESIRAELEWINPDRYLDALEAWVTRRKQENWKTPRDTYMNLVLEPETDA